MLNNCIKLFKYQNFYNTNTNNCYFFIYFKSNTVKWVKLRTFFRKYNFKIELIPVEKVYNFKLFNKIFISYNEETLLFFFPDILLIDTFKSVAYFCDISNIYFNTKLYYFPYLNLMVKNSIINNLSTLINILNISNMYFFFKKLYIFLFIISVFFFYLIQILFLNYLFYSNNFFFKYL